MNKTYVLETYGILKVSGPGTEKLLQGQLTCDINQITINQSKLAAHCNPQGRIISLFYLTKVEQDFYLIMPQVMVSIALGALGKYAPFFKAKLEDVSELFKVMASDNNTPFLGPSSQSHGDDILGDDDWDLQSILQGIPAIFPETSGKLLPHDINLQLLNAISFAKGCYTGQEIIARMHYRGKPKTHLYRGHTSALLAPGTLLTGNGCVINTSKKVYNGDYPVLICTDETSAAAASLVTENGQVIYLLKSE